VHDGFEIIYRTFNAAAGVKKEVQDLIESLKSKTKNGTSPKQCTFGAAKGFFKMQPDFDAPLDDFNEYM
jgi:hypothetical protein